MILKMTPLSSTLDEGPSAVKSWALNTSLKYFEKELDNLMRTATDWRFSASHATAQRIEDFKIENMAESIKNNAPQIWTMLSGLLQVKRKAKPSAMDNARVTDESHQDQVEEEDEYWGNLDGVDLGGFIDLLTSEDGSHIKETQKEARKKALITVVFFASENGLHHLNLPQTWTDSKSLDCTVPYFREWWDVVG